MSAPLPKLDLRDLAAIESRAREVLKQCAFLRANGGTDVIRFGLIANDAWWCWRDAAKADRRNARSQGWIAWRWRLPRGYDKTIEPRAAAVQPPPEGPQP